MNHWDTNILRKNVCTEVLLVRLTIQNIFVLLRVHLILIRQKPVLTSVKMLGVMYVSAMVFLIINLAGRVNAQASRHVITGRVYLRLPRADGVAGIVVVDIVVHHILMIAIVREIMEKVVIRDV